MDHKLAYLALHGFVACKVMHVVGVPSIVSIKRQLRYGEEGLYYTGSYWQTCPHGSVSVFTEVPWDEVSHSAVALLTWANIRELMEREVNNADI